MKLLHTSDWHLGKKLFKIDRHKEHEYFLNYLTEYIQENVVDILVIAGDIYDVPNPPHESIRLFYNFLQSIIEKTKCVIVMIAGNHDSGVLIESPLPLLAKDRVFIKGTIANNPSDHIIELNINNEPIVFALLPYFRSYEMLRWQKFYQENMVNNKVDIQEDIVSTLCLWADEIDKKQGTKILVAHHLFGKFFSSESEYTLNLNGLNSIPLDIFKKIDYFCLGHIHKYQKVSSTMEAYYTGSPIAFRFSENNNKKMNLINIQNNEIELETVEIPVMIDLEIIKCEQTEVIEAVVDLIKNRLNLKKSYLEIQLEIDIPQAGLIDQIREKLINSNIELISFIPIFKNFNSFEKQSLLDVNKTSIEDHFQEFYKAKYPDTEMNDELAIEFNQLLYEAQQITMQ